jgi:hypothetical protein
MMNSQELNSGPTCPARFLNNYKLWASTGAQSCDPKQLNWMNNIQRMPVWHRKVVLAPHNRASCRGWWKALRTCRKQCNKCDLTAAQCFWLAYHNDTSRWFAISSAPLVCCPTFSFMGELAKEYKTKLGCEKYFRRVTHTELLWKASSLVLRMSLWIIKLNV